MTLDLERLLAGKRALRQELQDLPVGEKLRLLDALRGRAVALRGSTPVRGEVREPRAPYAAGRQKGKSA